MVLLDASVLIDYLGGDEAVVDAIQDRATERLWTISLVAFEVYQGEVFKSAPADFDELERRLQWLSVEPVEPDEVRAAGELQDYLHADGVALAPRDAFVAGAAFASGEPLAHRDSDFEVERLRERVDLVRF